jgi:hypothetical protein
MNSSEGLAWLEQQALQHEQAARDIRAAIVQIAGIRKTETVAAPAVEAQTGMASTETGIGMTAVVKRVLENADEPLTPSEVYRRIVSGGHTLNSTSDNPRNMVGSTLQQLRKRGLAAKRDGGWILARFQSPVAVATAE